MRPRPEPGSASAGQGALGSRPRGGRRGVWLWLLLVALWPVAAGASGVGQTLALRGPQLQPLMVLAQVPGEIYGQPIVEIRFEGNRRVESEAMLLELESSVGELATRGKLASDLRRLWGLGYFEDVRVEGELTSRGVVLTYVVAERPTIRKIVVEGNDKVKLDDINEVLDLEKNEVLDLGKVKDNVEKVKALYTESGLFLADVSYELRPVADEPGKIDLALVVTESTEVIVRGIDFVGNKAFTDRELRKNIGTRVGGYLSVAFPKRAGGVFNRDAFQADYQFIRSFYGDHGYLDAAPKDPELSLSADRRFVYLTIPIDEGPQYTIGELRAREILTPGEKELFSEEVLAESIDPILKVGDVASLGKIQKIREDIELRYKDAGYANVNVISNSRPDKEKLELYMTLEVQKGPLVYIERIDITGNEKTADKVIRRELLLSEGDLYSETGKEQSQFRVLRLGYFSNVDISTSRGSSDDKVVLNIEVTEQLTGTFQIGAGFSTIENFVLQAQVQYDNFLGRGSTVSVVAQVSSLRRLFNLQYFTRYFLDSKWNFVFNVFNSQTFYTSFSRNSTGFRVSWGYPILRDLTLFLGYNLEYVQVGFGLPGSVGGLFSPGALVNIPSQALVNNLFSNGLTSALTANVQYDTRDNYLFPTTGMFHQLRSEFASRYFGSQNEYNRYLLDSRFYFPVIKSQQSFRAWLVFKTRLQVGYIHNTLPQGVPIFERYFPGGIFGDGMLRGYPLRSLGPRILVASSPDPTAGLFPYGIGGNLLTALNAELEFMIIPPANIKGVLFYDMGNAFNTEALYCAEPNPEQLPKSDPCGRFRFRDLRYSVGFGFRWQSPIGPLRFEWGIPLDRQRPTALLRRGEDPITFEFSIGNSF
ncbi:MAG: outer membrane protein assembly factor BamA [Myxococcales bacterium]|nr:outer membrane protein assembly factor BamA [Myxococcales bacterium]MCB9713725.1 outer membrane protein assembly factor BamA [Myxococcales bacterium]